jgi:hypothetical protein
MISIYFVVLSLEGRVRCREVDLRVAVDEPALETARRNSLDEIWIRRFEKKNKKMSIFFFKKMITSAVRSVPMPVMTY